MSTLFSSEILPIFLLAILATAGAALITQVLRPLLIHERSRREKAFDRLKERVEKKLSNNVELRSAEIADIGRGLDLSPYQSIEALYELYADAEEKEKHEIYRTLIDEIERTEPFEALPEEVRPSLARLAVLCNESTQDSDKELLQPLIKVLSEYQDMKRDHATIKKQSRISYLVALVSFFIGVVGLLLAFSGPSKEFIRDELQNATGEISEAINDSQQSDTESRQTSNDPEEP